MRYTFDPQKLAANVASHRVWFSAADGFEWDSAALRVDGRQSYGETRFEATAYIGLRLHVLIFTLRDASIRIISLRKANPREMKRYAKT